RHYFASVTMLDDQIGRIVHSLEERGLTENTVVIYTSDHGELLGEHGLFTKFLFYDGATRVPLIISIPGSPANVHDGLVELTDLSATLIELTGAEPIAGAPGRSLLQVTSGNNEVVRSAVRSEAYGFGMWRTDRYKLVVNEADL